MMLIVGSRPSVLVVDDDPLVLASLRRTLRHTFDVRTAGDAESALAQLSAQAVDLIVTERGVVAPGQEQCPARLDQGTW